METKARKVGLLFLSLFLAVTIVGCPAPVDEELCFSIIATIGGHDPAHQQISFRIGIANGGEEVLSNVRVSLVTKATNEESGWIWNSPESVTLEPGESETFHVTWEYDATHTSKEELSRLVDNLTTIRARYTTPEGKEAVQLLFPYAPYPPNRPPEEPPS